MLSSITNHYDVGLKRPRLACTPIFLNQPTDDWSYSHHPFITFYRNRYYVCYSNGHLNEDDVGQRVMYTTSDDFENWTEPRQLAQGPDPDHDVLIPHGFYVWGDTLVAYYLQFSYKDEVLKNGRRQRGGAGRVWHGSFLVYSNDGVNWSEPVSIGNVGCNSAPVRLKSGRLFNCGGRNNAYSDNPDGIHDWHSVEAFAADDPQQESTDGEGVSHDTPVGLVSENHVSLCEGATVELDDGTLYMFLRSGTPWLWACKSTDGGEHWTAPEKTAFTDNRTKFALGRLPNGRYFYIGTPDPFPPRTRHVLALSTSDNGLDYDRHFLLADAQYKGMYPGIDKNGVYGYPSALVKDGYLCVVVSINKERIIALRVPCDTL